MARWPPQQIPSSNFPVKSILTINTNVFFFVQNMTGQLRLLHIAGAAKAKPRTVVLVSTVFIPFSAQGAEINPRDKSFWVGVYLFQICCKD